MSTVISTPKMAIRAFLGLLLACCFISGITGDVPDGVVYTDLHLKAQLGSRAVLKCRFYGTPSAVYWKKGDNPSTAPNLIFWVEGEPEFGSCVKDKTCEMGDDYSLIIKNVSIADQGRYICRVSNYKGILLHNFTDIKVLAPPEEPYPFINECKENQGQNCILLATGPANITCTVLKYFPNVDLFFLHGIKKYSTADTLEWTNTDGTKSKSIFTTAPPSEIPYVCVAFNIPGSQEQRTATVTVPDQSDVATTMTAPTSPSSRLPRPSETDGPTERNKYFVIKIVVPIIAVFCVVTGIILFFTIYRRRQRRREDKNDDEHGEAMPMVPKKKKKIDGKISYYELWRLFREIDDTAVLRDTLRELRKTDIKEDPSEQEGYEILCTWKDNNRSGNEGEILNKALMKALKEGDYERAVDKFCVNRKDSSMKVYQHTLEHILWHINDLKKINKFLKELIPSRPTSVVNDSVDAIQSALRELTEWSNGQFDFNPYVSLSFALERAGYRPLAKTFFFLKLPAHLSPIEPKVIEEIVQKLTGRHCKRSMAGKISNNDLRSIIAENNDFLFDTKTMISDWIRKLECSDYEKKCRFDDAVIKIGRYDLLDCFGTMSRRPLAVLFEEQQNLFDHETIYDDDIPQLVKLIKYLPPDKISEFNKKTGLSADSDRDDNILEEDLRKRRDNILTKGTSRKASSQEFRSLRRELIKHTENFYSTVTDEEIEVVASQVIAADKQQELLRCLGMEAGVQQNISFADQLKEWRKTMANRRKGLEDSLKQIGFGECIASKSTKMFVYQAELSSIALNLLMEDVRPIIKALGIDKSTVNSYIQPVSNQNKGTKRLVLELLRSSETTRDNFCKTLRCIGFVDVSRSVYSDYEPSLSELMHIVDGVKKGHMDRFLKHLDLGADDIEECRDSEGQTDKLKLMRLWKRQIRPVLYHYRLVISTALRDVKLKGIAERVLSGDCRRKGLNADVLQSICSRLGDAGLTKVCRSLKLGPEFTSRSLEAAATPAASLLTSWVNEWMNKFDRNDTSSTSGHMKERKRVNDLLYINGYCELAEEISALENCQQSVQ